MSVTITMPQLGETVTEGTILVWVKQIGEHVAKDDILVEVSTDKVDIEIPSPVRGVLVEILVAAGSTVDVGTPIAIVSDEGVRESAGYPAPSADAEPKSDREQQTTTDDVTGKERAGAGRRRDISPVVRKLAAGHGVDLAAVRGTGKGGRITRKDVESLIAKKNTRRKAQPDRGGEPDIVALSAALPADGDVREIGHLRGVIAGNMHSARQAAAHVWTSVEVDYESAELTRAANREAFRAAEGFALTLLPFIARATMEALSAFPVVNSQFDLAAGTHTFFKHVNLGLAIDLDQRGLLVANVPGAESMTLRAIARSVRETAAAARQNKLGPDDLRGFTFSITNPGSFGSFMTAPIIPPPNAAILSTDAVTKRPVAVELADGSDAVAIHRVGHLGLSWDHSAFDGSTAALFLKRIKENIETWDWEHELR